MATNGVNHEQYAAHQTTDTPSQSNSKDLPKDEVGWYFVEQYYTTMSKSPEKLHLFYNKHSQFIYGQEAVVVPVQVGRQNIQKRIQELEFENCKVRISNVDSQGSEDHIVIQVIGETSNKAELPKKFVQTFVLAQQPSGYFVLNDILRYIRDEAEEETEEPGVPPTVPAVVETEEQVEEEAPVREEPPTKEAGPGELDAAFNQKLEEVNAAAALETSTSVAESTAAESVGEAQEPVEEKAEPIPEPEKVIEEIAEEEAKKPEEPKDPNPTPAVQAARPPVAPVVAEPEKPKERPKQMTWASRAAAAAGPPRPVVPKTSTPPVPTQTRAPVPIPAPTHAPAPPTQTAEPTPNSTTAAKDQSSEWQTAETKRQSRPQSMPAAPTENERASAYIKYVTDKVRDDDLRNALTAFGELTYFDINRAKNCAFVEFKTQAGYNAAMNANPHTVNGENITVEPRRPKANAYGGSNYSSTRGGGVPGRGRGGYEPQRSGSQGAGRGGFTGQSRGRGGAPRGRGASQAGNV
ncbi:putative ntf2 and rrm domain-containing protein [Podospora aff. communis PSN243]|uniref:Ntf2 and rrm domain-containing protein n=1 Tax=Podospora aff. communis PSN243 TaxID=3040156 RepID=A0AAV9H8W4_9PEZI|nr:putative ntf2 and rrm domain-containing protein [Podospora aff. communis PSN243]